MVASHALYVRCSSQDEANAADGSGDTKGHPQLTGYTLPSRPNAGASGLLQMLSDALVGGPRKPFNEASLNGHGQKAATESSMGTRWAV